MSIRITLYKILSSYFAICMGTITWVLTMIPLFWLIQSKRYGEGWSWVVKESLLTNLELQQLQQVPLWTIKEKIWPRILRLVWKRFSRCELFIFNGWLWRRRWTMNNSPLYGWHSSSEMGTSSTSEKEGEGSFLGISGSLKKKVFFCGH